MEFIYLTKKKKKLSLRLTGIEPSVASVSFHTTVHTRHKVASTVSSMLCLLCKQFKGTGNIFTYKTKFCCMSALHGLLDVTCSLALSP